MENSLQNYLKDIRNGSISVFNEARYRLKSIFRAPTYQYAVELKAAFIEQVKADKKYAHALRILEEGFAEATQYYAFPVQAHSV